MGFLYAIDSALNVKDLQIQTIEKYLYENLTINIWNSQAENYAP